MQIIETSFLSDVQKSEITALQAACNRADGLCCDVFLSNELNFDPDFPCFFLGYDAGELTAFLTVFLPTKREGEVAAFTAPARRRAGRFRALLRAAAGHIAAARVPRLLLRVDAESKSGNSMLTHLDPTTFDHAENRLIHWSPDTVCVSSNYTLHIASEEDESDYVALMCAAFGDDATEARRFFRRALEAPDREAVLLFQNGKPLGVCSIHYETEHAFLYGLGIRPDQRKQGCGRALLCHALTRCSLRRETVFLDVDTDNPAALGLYFSCGFVQQFRENYYALELTPERVSSL